MVGCFMNLMGQLEVRQQVATVFKRQSPMLPQQPQQTLAEMRTKLQEAKEVIYNQLSRKNNESPAADIEKAIALINKYEQITKTLNQIKQAEQVLQSKQKQKLIKQSLDETIQYQRDTAELIKKLKGRQELYQQQKEELIKLIQIIGKQTASVKEMQLEIKQDRLLRKSVSNLKQMYAELKQQQEKDTMFRKLRLTSEKDSNEYILNQIQKDSQNQLKHLKNKLEALQHKLRDANNANKVLTDEYYQVLKEFNSQKIKTTLMAQPAKPKPRQKKQDKGRKVEQKWPQKISEVQPIETELLVVPYSSKWQVYGGVLLGFITVCVMLQWVSKFYLK